MAWATPRTWVTGESVTKSMWSGVFAQLRATGPGMVGYAEDLLVGTGAADAPIGRLAVGASGKGLKAGASTLAWDTIPGFGVMDFVTDTGTLYLAKGSMAAVSTTYASGGSPTVPTTVLGWASASIDNTYGTNVYYLRVGISFDGGSTYDYCATCEILSQLNTRKTTIHHYKTGTPTGEVRVRLEGYYTGSTSSMTAHDIETGLITMAG